MIVGVAAVIRDAKFGPVESEPGQIDTQTTFWLGLNGGCWADRKRPQRNKYGAAFRLGLHSAHGSNQDCNKERT